MVDRLPRLLLRLEGLALLAGGLVLYFDAGLGWVWLLVFVLAPDLSALGYVTGPRLGAVCYDAVHTTVAPVALGVAGVVSGWEAATQAALIWLVHIGFDRLLGYGLKYPTAFDDTHLQRV